ncbi:aldehyde dehydrogenase [Pseudemcibacter aquimaris]|uniref:aldehyde dehydrogenase n=1 Tax=Pseudemcibacter aquimaris TaxID=2857064 RepID=UPI0020116136|nr:aldehyde dehydrogenase [Pseudemcibacter aquimaris]MCC3860185.1 aldehyde dehydrogenase [Pseudemcibacter aquimaris]WDU57511.1 aldehyde dehydrogenase [Pseudemcibacter aquimaris]
MDLPDYNGWKKLASELEHKTKPFIGGDYVDSASDNIYQTINPATEQVTAEISACNRDDVDMAVRYARAAFNKGTWSRMAARDRGAVLQKLAVLVHENADELALMECINVGKPIMEARMADINLASAALKWYGEAIDKLTDEIIATPDNVRASITREPMGVVGVVVPWNFPLLMACWKIAPALAAGNSVVVKPSEQTPQSILKLAELAIKAGMPDGVFNVVPGTGIDAGAALGLHNDVDCLTFTGSTTVGKKFLEYSGQSNMKSVWLECGGKNPNIVMADCPDMDKAVMNAAMNVFFNQGEICAAASRLLVEESIRDEFVARVAEIGKTRVPGDPLNPETNLGAIVDKTQFDRINGYIAKGKEEGADLVLGGDTATINDSGYYINPTIFQNVTNDMTIAREEIFGPVIAAISFKDIDEAIEIANDSPYGLAAGIWTSNINVAHRAARDIQAGAVSINSYNSIDIALPFGGYKQSGIGVDKSIHAIEKYTNMKSTWLELD